VQPKSETLESGSSKFAFVTPTYAGDIERVRLQRRCFRETETDIPHFVVVNTEDYQVFRAMFDECGDDARLLTTADVLPKWVETRRGKPFRRRDPRRWLRPQRISGWWAQQFVKLLAPEFTAADAFACLDSDTCPIRRVLPGDFFEPDGRLHLFAAPGSGTLTEASWLYRSYQAFSLSTDVPVHRFVDNPVPMKSGVVRRMREDLERRHDKSCFEVFLKRQLTEYATYGAYAMHLAGDEIVAVTPGISATLWFAKDVADLDALSCRIRSDTAYKFLCVQSHTNLAMDRVEKLYFDLIHATRPQEMVCR